MQIPSLVMNEMNSETHSCMHSFASFAIFAFSGKAPFMIRATGAKLRILASLCSCLLALKRCAVGESECGEDEDMMVVRDSEAGCRKQEPEKQEQRAGLEQRL